jgi:hypothetical protein
MGEEIGTSSANANRECRRQAAASRRSARANGIDNDGTGAGSDDGDAASQTALAPAPKRRRNQQHEQLPIQFNFLSSLSQALSNIDRHNRDYFSKHNESDDDNVIRVEGGSNNHNVHRVARMNKKTSSPPNNFASYLKFNRISLASLLTFTICYLLVLICCLPMITHSNDRDPLPTDEEHHDIQRGASFQYIRGRKQFIKAKHVISQKLDTWRERAAMRVEQQENNGTVDHDAILEGQQLELVDSIVRYDYFARRDNLLLEQAIHDFEGKSSDVAKLEINNAHNTDKGVHDHWKDNVDAWDKEFVQDTNNNVVTSDIIGKTPGFVVLGMHRSGTSMLSGLLVKGFGYETGGPLIGASVSALLFVLPLF